MYVETVNSELRKTTVYKEMLILKVVEALKPLLRPQTHYRTDFTELIPL